MSMNKNLNAMQLTHPTFNDVLTAKVQDEQGGQNSGNGYEIE